MTTIHVNIMVTERASWHCGGSICEYGYYDDITNQPSNSKRIMMSTTIRADHHQHYIFNCIEQEQHHDSNFIKEYIQKSVSLLLAITALLGPPLYSTDFFFLADLRLNDKAGCRPRYRNQKRPRRQEGTLFIRVRAASLLESILQCGRSNSCISPTMTSARATSSVNVQCVDRH